MDTEVLTNEELLNECIRRDLLSAAQAKRILDRPNREEKRRLLQQRADIWIVLHPKLFEFMERTALRLVAKKQRFGTRLLSEETRWYCSSESKNEKFKLANVLVSYIIKRIVEKHPEISKYMRMKS